MNTSCPIVLLTVLVGLTCALPPFEIRSAGSQKSEAAVDWIRHLQKDKSCFSRGLMLCPTSIYLGRNECFGEEMLCDGSADCPRGEDEDAELCYFFRLKERLDKESGTF